MSDFRAALPQFFVPHVVGAWRGFRDAIAKSLQELAGEIDKALNGLGITENPTLYVLVKDGGDGLGDVFQYKEKGDRYLEDKAFRYYSGSVRTKKTLIAAVCDENQTAAMVMCVIPVETKQHEQISLRNMSSFQL